MTWSDHSSSASLFSFLSIFRQLYWMMIAAVSWTQHQYLKVVTKQKHSTESFLKCISCIVMKLASMSSLSVSESLPLELLSMISWRTLLKHFIIDVLAFGFEGPQDPQSSALTPGSGQPGPWQSPPTPETISLNKCFYKAKHIWDANLFLWTLSLSCTWPAMMVFLASGTKNPRSPGNFMGRAPHEKTS